MRASYFNIQRISEAFAYLPHVPWLMRLYNIRISLSDFTGTSAELARYRGKNDSDFTLVVMRGKYLVFA